MSQLIAAARRLVKEEDGASASEYAILVAFIAVAVSVAVRQFNLNDVFAGLGTKVRGLINSAT